MLVGWCGMRGLVTLATAFLPSSFPQRDLIVLTAFAVVLATLVVQGLTLAPLVRFLKLDGKDGLAEELAEVRVDLASAALASLEGKTGPASDFWRFGFGAVRSAAANPADTAPLNAKRKLAWPHRRQRERLEELRDQQRVGPDAFLILQEELDFEEVAISSEDERHIEERLSSKRWTAMSPRCTCSFMKFSPPASLTPAGS